MTALRYALPICLGVLIACHASFAQAEDKPRPDPERFASAIAKFVEADADAPPKPGGILFVGSSSIRLWKSDESFPGRGIINRGFGGSMIQDSIHYADKIVLPYKPETIVLYAGDNDLNHGLSPEAVAADFEKFVKLVHNELPETRILFIAVKPSLKRWGIVDRIRKANALVEKFAESHEHVDYVDVFTPMLGEDGKPRPELLANDGLHMTPAGYAVWTEVLKPMIQEPATAP
jgi:lysophospholipase L1-like esterase